jgi:hypothetical protein
MKYRRPFIIIVTALTVLSAAEPINAKPAATAIAKQSGRQQDFDWEFGAWNARVRVLRNPLSGENPDWAVYEGMSIVKPLLSGRAIEPSSSSSAEPSPGRDLIRSCNACIRPPSSFCPTCFP